MEANISDNGWKVNPDLWELFKVIVLLGLTYQVRMMNLASKVSKNQLFKIFNLNVLESKFDLDDKNVKVSLGSSFEQTWYRPHIPNVTYQVPISLAFWLWRRILKGFYHIWAWRPSWFCDQDHLNELLFPHP